jgi:hypothetical protein
MPTYNFLNKETNEEFSEFMSISAVDDYLKENPHIEQLVNGSPMIVSGVPQKPDNGFRDLLKSIKKSNDKGFQRSSVNTF